MQINLTKFSFEKYISEKKAKYALYISAVFVKFRVNGWFVLLWLFQVDVDKVMLPKV